MVSPLSVCMRFFSSVSPSSFCTLMLLVEQGTTLIEMDGAFAFSTYSFTSCAPYLFIFLGSFSASTCIFFSFASFCRLPQARVDYDCPVFCLFAFFALCLNERPFTHVCFLEFPFSFLHIFLSDLPSTGDGLRF